ncbi:MAG TPA: MFS transporter [Micromonosporaceae bacterium]|nr:MFS transporter [Micromonosporaceae bacterium]
MPRLARDRVTWLVYAQLGIYGYFLYGLGPVVPLLRREQGTTVAVASLHSTALAVGALIGGALFPALVRRYGRGAVLWWSLAGLVLATGVFCLVRPIWATLAAVMAAAVVGTWVVTGTITSLNEYHGETSSAAISEANAAAAGMGIVAPLLIGAAIRAGWGWRPALFAVAGLVGLVAVVAWAFRVRVPPGSGYAGTPVRGPLPRRYWIAWALMGVTSSVEVCLSLWAAEVLRTDVGMTPGGSSAAVASIVVGMFIGRVVGGRVALRFRPVPLLLGALALSACGFATFWLAGSSWVAGSAWLAIAGLVLLGLGNAMHYPLAISMAVAAGGAQPDKAAAYASYSVAVGFGLGPLILGWVADGLGSAHLAFLLVPVLLAAAAVLAVRLRPTAPVSTVPG